MTPARLLECLSVLFWTKRGLARALKRSENTIRQWEAGVVRIPPKDAEWIETRAQHAERTPPPDRDPPPATSKKRMHP